MEIHPKVASLFLKGKSLREAFLLFLSIKAAIEPNCRPGLRVLEDFIRAAVTSTVAANPDSAMATSWSRFDHGTTEQLEVWFYKVVAKVPIVTPPAAADPLQMPPLPPPAPGNNNLLIAALTSLSQSRGGNDNPTGKAYHDYELPQLFPLCGYNPPYDVLSEWPPVL